MMSHTYCGLLIAICSISPLLGQALITGGRVTGGRVTGDSGGNERVVTIFDRGHGHVWQTVTGVSGRFRSPPLKAGEYLAVCQGKITPIEVRDHRASEILFVSQSTMGVDFETWSPERKIFGQTFRATGPWVNGFTFWNPGEALPLVAELRETGPGGRLIATGGMGQDRRSSARAVANSSGEHVLPHNRIE